jgi:hypothetical protein
MAGLEIIVGHMVSFSICWRFGQHAIKGLIPRSSTALESFSLVFNGRASVGRPVGTDATTFTGENHLCRLYSFQM